MELVYLLVGIVIGIIMGIVTEICWHKKWNLDTDMLISMMDKKDKTNKELFQIVEKQQEFITELSSENRIIAKLNSKLQTVDNNIENNKNN